MEKNTMKKIPTSTASPTNYKTAATTKPASRKERLKEAMKKARSFAVLLAVIFIGIKLVLFFTESSITLRWWEWIPIWPAISYQHIIVALICFGLYTGLFFIGGKNRPLGIAMASLVGIVQFVLPFLHISSLRVEQIIGSYTTFEMTQADSEGSIFLGALLDPENLMFTIPGFLLSCAATTLPFVFRKRAAKILSFLTLKRAAIIFGVWIVLGAAGARIISSFIGVTADDPVIFYYADLLEKELSLLNAEASAPNDKEALFPTEQIYGSKKIIPTKHLFSNLEKWRKTKQNIVLIVMESMPASQASFMGTVKLKKEVRDTMPNLKKMAPHMLLWENHYTVHPTSMNSLFSIGCSMYPYPGGGNITTINPRAPCESISEVLHKKGYKAALFHSGRFSFWKKTKFFKKRGFSIMRDARNMPGKNIEKFKWGIDEIATAEAVAGFIKKNKDKPFFIQYITVFPHVPYHYKDGPWAIYPSKKRIDKYHNCLRYEDAAIKIVTDTVKKVGLEDDTLFIFVSDHGEAFYEHPGNETHSIYVYEENVHVAFAMYNPILFPTHRSTKRVTSHIDILPTVADLIGAEHAAPWQGKSLLEDLASPTVYFFANWGSKLAGLRDDRYKAIWNRNKKVLQIFDLKKDKREKKDLIKKFSERRKAYHSALTDWWENQAKLISTFGK